MRSVCALGDNNLFTYSWKILFRGTHICCGTMENGYYFLLSAYRLKGWGWGWGKSVCVWWGEGSVGGITNVPVKTFSDSFLQEVKL